MNDRRSFVTKTWSQKRQAPSYRISVEGCQAGLMFSESELEALLTNIRLAQGSDIGSNNR
jgi:hypothetical protein